MRAILRGALRMTVVLAAIAGAGADGGELAVWVEDRMVAGPLPFSSISAIREDGTAVLLDVRPGPASATGPTRFRLVGAGKVPLGRYVGLGLDAPAPEPTAATAADPDTGAGGVPQGQPRIVPIAFEATAERGTVLTLAFRPRTALDAADDGAWTFAVSIPARPSVEALGVVTLPEGDAVALFDRGTGQVVDWIQTAREPRGIDLGPAHRRAFVACAGEDMVSAIDLGRGRVVVSRRLRAGDAPWDVAATPDGRTVLVANAGSGTVVVLDAATLTERKRVRVGTRPVWLLPARDGARVFVFDELADAVTAIDAGSGGVTALVDSPGGPFRGELDRTGERLYVIHRTSPYLGVLDALTLESLARVYIGPGASALAVDPRSGRIHVAMNDPPRVEVFDAVSFLAASTIPASAPVTALSRDARGNRLCIALAEANALRLVEFVGQRDAAIIELPHAPGEVAFVGD